MSDHRWEYRCNCVAHFIFEVNWLSLPCAWSLLSCGVAPRSRAALYRVSCCNGRSPEIKPMYMFGGYGSAYSRIKKGGFWIRDTVLQSLAAFLASKSSTATLSNKLWEVYNDTPQPYFIPTRPWRPVGSTRTRRRLTQTASRSRQPCSACRRVNSTGRTFLPQLGSSRSPLVSARCPRSTTATTQTANRLSPERQPLVSDMLGLARLRTQPCHLEFPEGRHRFRRKASIRQRGSLQRFPSLSLNPLGHRCASALHSVGSWQTPAVLRFP